MNRVVSTHVKVIRIITAGTGISLIISVVMLVLDLSGVFNVVVLAVPVGAIYFLMAMVWPNGYSMCLSRFPDAGGSANALVSGLFIMVSAAFTATASLLESATAWPMWSLYICVLAGAGLFFAGLLRSEFDYKVG